MASRLSYLRQAAMSFTEACMNSSAKYGRKNACLMIGISAYFVHKKGDPTVRTNFRGICLLNIAYKVLSSVICERLKPIVNQLIGPYQCGFRPGKSTIDQFFTLRQILEKT